MKSLVLAALAAPAAFGQFALFQVDGDVERPVAAVFDIGPAYPAEPATTRFRIRNTTDAAAPLTLLAVHGSAFSLGAAPRLPAGIAAHGAIDFSVVFQAASAAGYSATLETDGVSVLLTATVRAGFTFQAGGSALSPAGIDFGSVEAGGQATKRITLANLSGGPLAAPLVSVTGDAFSVAQPPALGTQIDPGLSSAFDVMYRPPAAGSWTGVLTIGDRSYRVMGTATGPPLPQPTLTVDLPSAQSAQQGTISVALDSAARSAGGGTLSLDFQPLAKAATDPAIQLGVVGRSLPFPIAPGDTQAHFGDLAAVAFQTGTTAGTITIAVDVAGAVDRKTITIPPAAIVIQSAQGARTAAGIELRVTAFDNTRTAGAVVYTFYDAAGSAVTTIQADNTADFASYFAASDAGGAFALRAVFPVTGEASGIDGFAVQMTNSIGPVTTGRLKL